MRRKISVLALAGIFTISALVWYTQRVPYSPEAVANSVWEKYGVQSMQVGKEGEADKLESVIRIDVYDENDIPKVEQYLEKKLSKEDLTKFEIDIFSNGDRDSYNNH